MSMRAACLLLAVLLAACSGTTKPAVTPGQTAVIGDATFLVREDGRISVTVTRTFEGQTASGLAVLQDIDLETAKHSVLVRVAGARAWLAITQAFEHDPPHRYLAAQRAVEELGTEYRKARPNLIDDTNKHLLIAQQLAEQGDQAAAADEVLLTLQSRLALYVRCFRDHLEG